MIRLLDTNHAIAHLNGDSRLKPHLALAKRARDEFAIATTVLGELFYGAYASHRVSDNLEKLAAFVAHLIVYDFNSGAAEEFGRIRAEQRAKGKPIPTADAQIAAIARLYGLTILTNDAHLGLVDRLLIDNWLL